MFLISMKVNDVETYRMKVESLVSRSECYWYGNVYTKGLPSIKEINDRVNFDKYYSFAGYDKMGYSVCIQIEKEM